ncbi:ethanolamine ammonia-lyase subunit EutB [Wenyingzhuangia sp. IMCC45574]
MKQTAALSALALLFNKYKVWSQTKKVISNQGVHIQTPKKGEDVLAYIYRTNGKMDISIYRQIIGAANEFKEGDLTLGIAAADENSRINARTLLANTKIKDLKGHSLFTDAQKELIDSTTETNAKVDSWTLGELKSFVLTESEAAVKEIMLSLTSDVIACTVKLMSNEELIQVGQKIFNPLTNSQIGSKGYLSARVQPNSPTDNIEDIQWQVFDAWSYGVGDLLLGTNPVSSKVDSVANIEATLFEIIQTFGLETTLPNCVLSHIDIQAEVEEQHPGTTGVWFQSLAGTVNANQTFDVTLYKMFGYADKRNGQFGMYAETGQGADFTNGHGEGFDMMVHEARKYGFVRALKQKMFEGKAPEKQPWVFVNDVAGFIGPEVFRSREQLVRCCLEDIAMGKLHGLTLGLDICSTLHMDVNLDDLDWCIDQIMPANPAYLMALPTKNDPMLSYLTTSFSDHVRVREKFGYKVNDAMWAFFKRIGIIDQFDLVTDRFGDPIWVYYQYCLSKGDKRSQEEVYKEGKQAIERIRKRGVPIAEGYGENIWDLNPELDKEIRSLYEDAKVSLWTEMTNDFVATLPSVLNIKTKSVDRKDYVYHPESGEKLNSESIQALESLKQSWGTKSPDLAIIISDGLNSRAIMDDGHLTPFLEELKSSLTAQNYKIADENIVITHGRVRAGYACGEILFGNTSSTAKPKGIIHVIGERPGSGHHNFSAYITSTTSQTWGAKGKVDHDITKVVSGISDTALRPKQAVLDTVGIYKGLVT